MLTRKIALGLAALITATGITGVQLALATNLWIASNSQGPGLGQIEEMGGTVFPEWTDTPNYGGLAFNFNNGTLYGSTSNAGNTQIHEINQADGTSMSNVGLNPVLNWVQGITYDSANDTLYAVRDNQGIFTVDPKTGARGDMVTVAQPAGSDGRTDGLAFDNVNSILYGISEVGPIYTINTSTGDTSHVATLPRNGSIFVDMAYQDGFLYTATILKDMFRVDVRPGDTYGEIFDLGKITTNLGRTNAWAPSSSAPPSGDSKWSNAGGGDWNSGGNWRGPLPSGTKHPVIFGDAIEQPSTVFVDSAVTINSVTFDNVNSYILAGAQSFNFNSGTSTPVVLPKITVAEGTQGDHQFQAVVNLLDDTTVEVSSDSTLTFNNQLNLGGNTLTKTGAGEISIRNDFVTAGGVLNISEGTVSGNGTVSGDVNNDGGVISPGNSSSGANLVPEPTALTLLVFGMLLTFCGGSLRRR